MEEICPLITHLFINIKSTKKKKNNNNNNNIKSTHFSNYTHKSTTYY